MTDIPSNQAPRFELQRVYADGTKTPPEVVPISELPLDLKMGRRGFLGVGLAASAVLAALSQREAQAEAAVAAKRIAAHHGSVNALTLALRGKYLVSASDDQTLKVWTMPDGRYVGTLAGHTDGVTGLASLSTHPIVASAARDHTVGLWSLAQGGFRAQSIDRGNEDVRSIAMGGKLVAWGTGQGTIILYDLEDNLIAAQIPAHTDAVTSLAFTPTASLLASCSRDNAIKLWRLDNYQLFRSLTGHQDFVNDMAISSNGRWLASASGDKSVRLWSLPRGEPLTVMNAHESYVSAVAISPDRTMLASGAGDKRIYLWSLPAGQLLGTLQGHGEDINTLTFSADSRYLASGDYDGVIIIWDVAAREARSRLIDPACNDKAPDVRQYTTVDSETRQTLTFVQPCGTPIPAGAVCTCNCVSVPRVYTTDEVAMQEDFIRRRVLAERRASQDANGGGGSILDRMARTEAPPVSIPEPRTTTVPGPTFPTQPGGGLNGGFPNNFDPFKQTPQGRAAAREAQRQMERMVRQMREPRSRTTPGFPGGFPSGGVPSGGGGGSVCTCNQVCVCIPVCQAHKLLDADPFVRSLAEQLLLWMGRRELPYMQWAARRAHTPLRRRIMQLIRRIRDGAGSDPRKWPAIEPCVARLDHSDEVVSIMAAQMLALRSVRDGERYDDATTAKMAQSLSAARRRPWFARRRSTRR